MTERKVHIRQSVDWVLVGLYLLLVFIGWISIYAATHSTEPGSLLDWNSRAGKQFVWILTALGLAIVILYVLPPKLWEATCIPFYVFVLGLLVLVIFYRGRSMETAERGNRMRGRFLRVLVGQERTPCQMGSPATCCA